MRRANNKRAELLAACEGAEGSESIRLLNEINKIDRQIQDLRSRYI